MIGLRKVYKDHRLHNLFGVTLMAVVGCSDVTPALTEIWNQFGDTSGQMGLLITVITRRHARAGRVPARLSEPDRRKIEEIPLAHWTDAEGRDERTWNLGCSRAQYPIGAQMDVLREAAAGA